MCLADLNNDKKDDLLVGAPYHSSDTWDEGRVYVFISKKGEGYKGMEKKFVLKGQCRRISFKGVVRSKTSRGYVKVDGLERTMFFYPIKI